MSYPANMDFERDPSVTLARWKVYVRYCRRNLAFHEPRGVKVRALSELLRDERGRPMHFRAVIAALNWLVEQGYVRDHGRDETNTRQLSLVFERRCPNGNESAA